MSLRPWRIYISSIYLQRGEHRRRARQPKKELFGAPAWNVPSLPWNQPASEERELTPLPISSVLYAHNLVLRLLYVSLILLRVGADGMEQASRARSKGDPADGESGKA